MAESVPVGAGGGSAKRTTTRLFDELRQVRRLIPAPLVPWVVRRRVDRLWKIPAFRAGAEAQMRYLLEFTDRAEEAPDLAYGYAEQTLLRAHLRWHPRVISRQRVEGIEWLTSRRDPTRGVVVSFMHHAQYGGMFASLARAGAIVTPVQSAVIQGKDTPGELRQHFRNLHRGVPFVDSTVGTDHLVEMLQRPGTILAIASDVPSRTPVTFLGRRVMGAFGAARIASLADSPVVLVTTRRDDRGSYFLVEPPIDPRDHPDPRTLLDAMLLRHEEAILAWPEAFEVPKARFAPIEAPT
jgi:lauroyl/myristoyl acyltransferase